MRPAALIALTIAGCTGVQPGSVVPTAATPDPVQVSFTQATYVTFGSPMSTCG